MNLAVHHLDTGHKSQNSTQKNDNLNHYIGHENTKRTILH